MQCSKGHELTGERYKSGRPRCLECLRPDPAKCGTRSNYEKHLRFDGKTCDACRKVNAARRAKHNRNARRKPRPKCIRGHEFTDYRTRGGKRQCLICVPLPAFDPMQCGTAKNYRKHKEFGQEPCGPCRRANSAREARYRDKKRKRKLANYEVRQVSSLGHLSKLWAEVNGE